VSRLALSDNPEHRDLVRLLIQRLAYEQEVGWLDAIIQVGEGGLGAVGGRVGSYLVATWLGRA